MRDETILMIAVFVFVCIPVGVLVGAGLVALFERSTKRPPIQ
jgi:hypothetical protein